MSKYKISYYGWSDEASPIKSDVKIHKSHKQLVYSSSDTLKLNGLRAATGINKDQGKNSVENKIGIHNPKFKNKRKEWASNGGKVGGVITRDSGKLKEHSKLGNEANQQKHGKRIIATNLITEECWEYISIREAERDTKIAAPTIRKIIKGEQPKTKNGWVFVQK